MRGVGLALALLGALAAAGDLEGRIESGKAKRLVEEALPLYREADAIYRAWVLDEIPEEKVVEELKRAIALYDEATAKLSNALDIRYDPTVNHLVRLAARKLAGLRFRTEFRRPPPPTTRKPQPEKTPPAKPEPERPPPEPEPEPEPPAPAPRFEPDGPPAKPVDVVLPATLLPEGNPSYERIVAEDQRAIRKLLRDYFHARKRSKLLFRHRICRGKGCQECHGTGLRINLHYFRKTFWTCYAPSLRDAPGALEALKAFHDRAARDPAALGPLVKSFRILEVEHKGYWARARVLVKTEAGEEERAMTLIGIGRSWFFFQPATDGELLPGRGLR